MTDWTSGYVAGIDYTYDFHRQLTPALLGFGAMSQGHRHRLHGKGVAYCELGCGQGFSANLLAAANPQIEFHAMDFSPSQIAGAAELAKEASLPNVHFHECSFAEFDETRNLPESFDIIALHGVYSWVSLENRKHITDFISRHLKPGGLVYISYNTQPGWSAAAPLRRILASRAEHCHGPLPERIRDAVAFAKQLEAAGAGFFAQNPGAGQRLAHMKEMPANYLAHEYFNRDWTPFFFEDLAFELSQAKLDFLGSVHPMDNVGEICFGPEQKALLDSETDPVRREGLRDILLNEHFRTDIFVKGKLAFTPRGEIGAWFELPLALIRPYSGGVLKFHHRGEDVQLDQKHYAPVLLALTSSPQTVRDLLDQGVFGDMDWSSIARMLTVLCGSGCIAPCPLLEGLEQRAETCRAFNLAVCKRAEDSDELRYSGVSGYGRRGGVGPFRTIVPAGARRRSEDAGRVGGACLAYPGASGPAIAA